MDGNKNCHIDDADIYLNENELWEDLAFVIVLCTKFAKISPMKTGYFETCLNI